MKKHTLQSAALILAMALSCTGCGLFGENDKKDKDSKTETTAEATRDSKAEAEETEDESKEEPEQKTAETDVIRPLHPNIRTEIKSSYLQGEGYAYVRYWLQTGGISLDSDEAGEYPELSRALTNELWSFKENAEGSLADLKETAVYAQENAEYDKEFMAEYTPYVVRADSRALSYELFYEDYYGGAHGYESYAGRTFDSKTGKQLSFYDVITDENTARTAIADALRKQCADSNGLIENNTPEDDAKAFFECLNSNEYSESVAWTLGADRLNIYYNPYNIGSFALGIVKVSLLFQEYPDVVKAEYQEAPSGYAVHIGAYSDYMADIYNNGSYTRVSANYDGNLGYSYSEYSAVRIDLQSENGQTTSRVMDDVWEYFDMDVYYVTENGRHFLHVFTTGEDDWTTDFVYEITNGQIESCGHVDGSPAMIDYDYYDQGEWTVNTSTHVAYTDPQRLSIFQTMNTLSTYIASRHYAIGKNGLPESNEPYKAAKTEIAPVLKTDLTVSVTDSSGKETGKTEVLPAGTVLHFYMTDNETYVIFSYGDGKYGKVSVDSSDWPQRINGQDMESVLDGTAFAG